MARKRTLFAALSAVAAAALVVTIAAVWPGLDAQQTPPVDTGVWALQTADGKRYARVNTALGEIDTVRGVSNPSSVVQNSDGVFVFSESFGKITQIDEAMPVDLDAETTRDSKRTPDGTVEVVVAGDFAVYRTDAGAIFAGRLAASAPAQVDPNAGAKDDEDAPRYAADAVTIDESGVVYSYSARDKQVLRSRAGTGEVLSMDAVKGGPSAGDLRLTAVDGQWLLVEASDEGRAWTRGRSMVLPVVGAVAVQRAGLTGGVAYVADEAGLIVVPLDGGAPKREFGDGVRVLGQPARPTPFDGDVFAAWLPSGEAGGALWRESGGESALSFGGGTLSQERRPSFVTTRDAIMLNETRSGWVWTLPDGALVPSSQDWSLDDRRDPDAGESEQQAVAVLAPKPPIAQPDAFGVRAGSLAALPVLLNDHDPNEDVLSIDPASVGGLDPAFGVVTLTDNGQRLAVRVAPDAQGSASFAYRVSDGTSAEGLYSEPATVTLTVASEGENQAPVWCGAADCLVPWPAPEVAPGGTISVPVLPGWVDPDGDPLLLLAVENTSGVGAVAATPAGEVVYQHADSGAGESQLIDLTVTVGDVRGATTTKSLVVRVSPTPALKVQSFAVVQASTGVSLDIVPHVSATAGKVALSEVRVLDDADATAVIGPDGTTIDFEAGGPGEYLVAFTVGDGTSEASGTVRVTVLAADAAAGLATAPVVAFVQPKQDVTIDVFTAVHNPTGRVLLLSDVSVVPAEGASLTLDVVAQNALRVAGTTASGVPGPLGTVRYTVSDGTDDVGARVEGEATVYLLPPAPELAPIAVDDAIVVRAGTQVDIPVTQNDIAPSGSAIQLNPASVVSSSPDALAFASGSLLRYLAPTEPGTYAIEYGIFSAGAPSLADTATVRVTVLGDDANRAPRPTTLEGRVLSGQATSIDFHGFGVDPDGDAVELEQIETQPASGSAALSADGASIIYTSVPGFQGQVSFRYRVRDGAGATGVGTVRVGVLDGQTNPSPVTFTDYVQVQARAGHTVRVSPTANDLDPAGGTLAVTGVVPDAAPRLDDGSPNPEFGRLQSMIIEHDKTTVVLEAGDEPGTMSFFYDVESDSGNTARGLIVVKVVREAVPDYPVVRDTVLTTQTLESFRSGVDVVSGQVSWSGGDPASLSLSLWGTPSDVQVQGRALRGELPERARVIPFALTGTGPGGEALVSYGFLRVPGTLDQRLALRTGVAPQEVKEREAVTFDMAALVAVPRGMTLEVGERVAASGARAGAVCTLEGGTRVRYDAGEGAPWADACIVPVRMAGATEWTYVSVPISISAVEPQPILRPASLTVAPGETVEYDLRTLTSWQWKQDWAGLTYGVQAGGPSFVVQLDGSILRITAADRAVPGLEEAVSVAAVSHPDVAPTRLTLRVGAAPSTLPSAGTMTQQCSQAAGSSCTFSVGGARGVVNPLPNTPLELVDVQATGVCTGISFSVASASTITASWAADAPGATCAATFTQRDAQGRITAGERAGSLLLDLQGFPRQAAAVTQVGYGDGSVTLRVDPGEARLAYPALAGFSVRRDGAVVAECSADGVCPSMTAPNGEERTYEVVARNAVGSSRGSVSTVAWAYDVPASPAGITVTPVVTAGEGGVVAIAIGQLDGSETGALEITSTTGASARIDVSRGATSAQIAAFRVGANTQTPITITPLSRFPLPPGLGGSTSGAAVTVYGNGIGAPIGLDLVLAAETAGAGVANISARVSADVNGYGAEARYGFALGGAPCVAASSSAQTVFPGLNDGEEYAVEVCVESWFEGQAFGRAATQSTVRAVQSANAPRGYTFVVDATPNYGSNEARWSIKAAPASPERPPRRNEARFNLAPGAVPVYDRDPGLQVQYCHTLWGTCGDPGAVAPAAGSAPYQVVATWRVASCEGGSPVQRTGTTSNNRGTLAFDFTTAVYRDVDGKALATTTPEVAPVGAVRVEGIGVKTSWPVEWNLTPSATTMSGTCTPALPPVPEGPAP